MKIYNKQTLKEIPLNQADHFRDDEKIVLHTCEHCGKDTPNELTSGLCNECLPF